MSFDKHVVVAGLGAGDEAKGSVVDYLCAEGAYKAVVRYNGGSQAAHNVVMADGRHHTFSQFGSGSFRGVPTYLSRHMLVNPLNFLRERDHLLSLGLDPRVFVHRDCLVTTPYHVYANRSRPDEHGTTGMGIGETVTWAMEDGEAAIRVSDLADERLLKVKLAAQADRLYGSYPDVTMDQDFAGAYEAFLEAVEVVDAEWEQNLFWSGPCLFEGAQGVLLDQWVGMHPFTTWSTTTFDNAVEMLIEAGQHDYFCLGVLRAYASRHGAGPLPTEDPHLDLPDAHNDETTSMAGKFRVGHLDLVTLRYALEAAGGADGLALTHLDRTEGLKVCHSYEVNGHYWEPPAPLENDLERQNALTTLMSMAQPVLTEPEEDWRVVVEKGLGVPVVLESRGPTSQDKKAV